MQIFVFFPDDVKVGMKHIRTLAERMRSEGVQRAIMVAPVRRCRDMKLDLRLHTQPTCALVYHRDLLYMHVLWLRQPRKELSCEEIRARWVLGRSCKNRMVMLLLTCCGRRR